jgi:hypothetical protein
MDCTSMSIDLNPERQTSDTLEICAKGIPGMNFLNQKIDGTKKDGMCFYAPDFVL